MLIHPGRGKIFALGAIHSRILIKVPVGPAGMGSAWAG